MRQRRGLSVRKKNSVPELLQLNLKLGNFVNIEREHADKLVMLLFETMERLAECYEIPLPEGWDAMKPKHRD